MLSAKKIDPGGAIKPVVHRFLFFWVYPSDILIRLIINSKHIGGVFVFLKDIQIIHTEPCIADPDKIRLKAELSDDVTEIMPFLNTVINNGIFNKNAPLLTFTKEFRLIVLYPKYLTMAKAVNLPDALQILHWLKNLMNETWEKKDTITPNYEKKQRPTVLQLYGWLPKTNCKKCGEVNCFAFATLLLQGIQQIENCKPLFTPDYKNTRGTIMELLNIMI